VTFPLRRKLALLASALLVAGIGTVSWLVLDLSSEALENEVRKRAVFLAEQLARNVRDPVLLENDLVTGLLLETTAAESEVLLARVLDKEGILIASSGEGELPTAQRHQRMTRDIELRTRSVEGQLIVAARLTFGDVDLGEVQVFMDLQAVLQRTIDRARRKIALAASGLLFVGLLIAFALSGRISRPLQRLRLATDALTAGDLSAPVVRTSNDEVGVLTDAFNDMSQSLSQKRRIETAFRRYLSDHVLQGVINSNESIELKGERREVTVLWIDIRQFTRLTASIGPERLVSFLNETFELITSRLLEHDATVDKYIGDAILAYLGAPIETADHAERAVAAAIAVQRSVLERNQKCEASGEPFVRLEVGIGIQTGTVVVGNIGSELKMDFTVIGEPVNIANRIQGLAGPTQIMITGEVREHLAGRIDVEPLGPRFLNGIDEPIDVFRVRY
jgi:adenylate cyclase